ncbi:MAG: hypothetical protein ACKVQK_00480 [Burkholderiales bacterium]
MKGRRSSRVQLVALGSVVLSGCSDEIPTNRFVYANRPACITEWGERNCESNYFGNNTTSYGPRFGSWINLPSGERIWSGTPNTPSFHPQTGKHLGANSMLASHSNFASGGGTRAASGGASNSVSRGGFGSSGQSFSSGS